VLGAEGTWELESDAVHGVGLAAEPADGLAVEAERIATSDVPR
jgi:hypothetical protein